MVQPHSIPRCPECDDESVGHDVWPARKGIRPVTRHQSPVDQRPFQAKSALELQQVLERHYRRIAIPELAAALRQQEAPRPERDSASAKAA